MNKITICKNIGLALSTALILSACGGGSTSSEPTGLDRIVEYAQNGGTAPTLQDYLDAGVTGIDSEEKLAEINQVVEGLVAEDVDTTQEVQALAYSLGVEVPPDLVAPSPSPSPSPSPDTTPPVITITGGSTATVVQFSTYTDAGATATDDVDGAVTVTITGTVDTSTLGDYNITYSATDTAANTATATRTVTAFSITHNGFTYGIVTSPYTGKVWLDRNLGAAQVCTTFDDTACYGDYYQWGRNFDGHQDSTSGTTPTQATDVNNVGIDFIITQSSPYDWASVDSTGASRSINWSKTNGSSVCPVGFRVPNITELRAETLDNGVTNIDTAFTNFLKLPSAGLRIYPSGNMSGEGGGGVVWTSSVDSLESSTLGFDGNSVDWYNGKNKRASGFSVRCLKD